MIFGTPFQHLAYLGLKSSIKQIRRGMKHH